MKSEEAIQGYRAVRRAGRSGVLRSGAIVVLAASLAAWAKEPDASARVYVEQGGQAFARGDYAGAAEAYAKAQETDPDSAEVAYNLGVAYYKQGELAKAKKFFSTALNTRDVELEARSKFNLGNVAYRQGLAKRSSAPEAVQLLQTAIAHYRDALDVRSEDEDARVNIELAQRLIQDLQEKQKEGEDQKNRQEPESKDEHQDQPPPQSQPSGDPKQRDKQEQDKQREQNGEDQENQEEQKQNPEQKAGNQEKPGEKKKSDASAGQDNLPVPPAEQSPSGDKPENQPQAVQAKALSREEADRLLQSVRDRERARRQKIMAQMRAERMNVKRDW
jgi:Ca-activated chloride channel homolog